LGALIRQAYGNIINTVGEFTDSATRELKSKTIEDMWEGCRLKRGVWNYYYVSYSRVFEGCSYLESRLKTNCKENELLRPDSTRWSIWV